MPPRKQVRRLVEITLVRLTELVGRGIVEFARRCDSEELDRNAALVQSNVCVCVPAEMYDDFAVRVLQTISQVVDSAEISETFLHKVLASPIMTIIDQLSTVEPYPKVSIQLVMLVYMNLRHLKKLRKLVINDRLINDLSTLCRSFHPTSSIIGGKLHWLENCDLQFMKSLKCPDNMCDEYTFSVLAKCSRLEDLTIEDLCGRNEIEIFNHLGQLSGLRELNIQSFIFGFDGVLANLLSRIRHLKTLIVSFELEFFLELKTIYPALTDLYIRREVINSPLLRTVATLFPNVTFLEVYLAERSDPSTLTAFPRLSTLHIIVGGFPLVDLWKLLSEIGHKVVSLEIRTFVSRSDLLVIYEHCRNCEMLEVSFGWFDKREPLIVPPFPKLKYLAFETEYRNIYSLVFTEMPSLECMRFWNFEITHSSLESILLDSKNFPCLTQVMWPVIEQESIARIERFIEQHNLDVTFVPTHF